MPKTRWKPFPYADKAYDYAGTRLKEQWSRLHHGDCEPYPTLGELKKLVERHREFAPSGSLEQATAKLQDAWRAYHRGDFGLAVELGLAVGPLGYGVANKAANIYATYLETSESAKLALFFESAERAEFIFARDKSIVNAWYFHAQALGRYSQGISVLKALAAGLGGKVRTSLEQAIRLEPRHADAHIAFGAYHAEIINKVGAMLGGLTYGASSDEAVKHYRSRAQAQSAFGDRPHRIRQWARHDVRQGQAGARDEPVRGGREMSGRRRDGAARRRAGEIRT